MHNTLKKTINTGKQLIEHNGENIMKKNKEQRMKKNREQRMKKNREQVMQHKPLLFTRPENAGALLLFALLALSLPKHTAALSEGDYTYSLISGNEAARIDGWTGSDVDLVIPDTLGGKPVTEIGNFAFSSKTALQSVSFPSSLTEIGFEAFYQCTGLTELTLSASLTEIGPRAFYQCTELTELTLPASLTEIGRGAFFGCTGLTELTLPDSLTEIKETAFAQCNGLTELTLPASLTEIEAGAFRECIGLTELTLPASLTEIEAYAFADCNGLQTALFEGHEPLRVGSFVFAAHAADFKVQFYEGARGFTDLRWSPNPGDHYPAQMLPILSLSFWRTFFGLTEENVTAANGEPLLIAYALNLNPEDAAARIPVPFVENGAFRLDFPADRSGVLLQVERSTDLFSGNWQPAGTVTNTSGTASVWIPFAGYQSPEKLYLRFTASEQTE